MWLNVANGSLPLVTPLDTDRNGTPDRTAAQVIEAAEIVRLDPASTSLQLQAAEMTLKDLQRFGL